MQQDSVMKLYSEREVLVRKRKRVKKSASMWRAELSIWSQVIRKTNCLWLISQSFRLECLRKISIQRSTMTELLSRVITHLSGATTRMMLRRIIEMTIWVLLLNVRQAALQFK